MVLSVLLAPWQLTALIILIGLLTFRWFVEAIVGAILINLFYGQSDNITFTNPLLLVLLILVLLEIVLKPRLRYYDEVF